MEYVMPLIGGLLLYFVISWIIRLPGRLLQSKFVSLGNLQGRTEQEIIRAVGAPSSVSAAGNGGKLLQWMATGYHIALLFDGQGRCEGVTHECA